MESRLILRDSNFDDCMLFSKWEQDPKVTRFFTINEGRDYEEITREFIVRNEDVTQRQFTICIKNTNEPIGRIYISNINRHYDSLDITRIYIADTDKRGKGYGEEALRLVLKWAFHEMKVERVTLDYFVENEIAANLYEKVGFIKEGVMRHGGKKNGEYVDMCLMSMLKEEYYK